MCCVAAAKGRCRRRRRRLDRRRGEPVGERVAKVEASLSELSGRLKALEDAARG